MAIAIAITRPNVAPPPKAAPTPIPSAAELDRHDAHDQKSPSRILAAQRPHRLTAVLLEIARGQEHEKDPESNAQCGAPDAAVDSLERQAGTRCEHHARSDSIGCPEHQLTGRANEHQRQRSEPGRQRCRQRRQEHCQDAWLHYTQPRFQGGLERQLLRGRRVHVRGDIGDLLLAELVGEGWHRAHPARHSLDHERG